jgi:hypothetical protein
LLLSLDLLSSGKEETGTSCLIEIPCLPGNK